VAAAWLLDVTYIRRAGSLNADRLDSAGKVGVIGFGFFATYLHHEAEESA
jgi:hypothetical protein